MIFDRIAIFAGDGRHVSDRDAAPSTRDFDDAHGQLRQPSQNQLLAFDFARETCFLLLQYSQEKYDLRLPVGRCGADCGLRAAEREVVRFFALLDHTFE